MVCLILHFRAKIHVILPQTLRSLLSKQGGNCNISLVKYYPQIWWYSAEYFNSFNSSLSAKIRASRMPKKKNKEPSTKIGEEARERSPFEIIGDGSILVKIHAKPGAKQNRITELSPDFVGVQIAAQPKEGEANDELVRYMSSVFGVKKSTVTLDKGAKSRDKIIRISLSGLTLKQAKDLVEMESKET